MSQDKVRILVAESVGFATEAAEQLSRAGQLTLADVDRNGLLSAVPEVNVLWVRLRHKIDAQVLSRAPRLKIIVTSTTGLNHIDLEEAGRRGIHILSLCGESDFLQDVRATAEHTIALILLLLRHAAGAVTHVKDGGWNRDLFRGHELYGKTVGVVGYGRLGRIVSRYLQAFDTRVLTTDPKLTAEVMEAGVTRVSLNELLQEANLVTLHVNLSRETRGFFGAQQFEKMKRGAWFVNTSRGELLNESALLSALESGHLGGAALDVICDEYSRDNEAHPLIEYARQHDNLVITPHIGGCTVESIEKTECFLAHRLLAHLEK